MNILLTTNQLIFTLSTIISLIGLYIFIRRQFFQLKTNYDFTPNHYFIGLIAGITACIGFINWTTSHNNSRTYQIDPLPPETIINVPTSAPPKKIVPPPAPPVTTKTQIPKIIKNILLTNDNESVDTEKIIKDLSADIISPSVMPDTIASPAPIVEPIIPKNDGNEVVFIADQMPRFPGCEDLLESKGDKEECAKKMLLEYVYKNLKYPALAMEIGLEGMVVVQFVVTKKGRIDKVKVVRDIGGGCGDQAKAVVNKMNDLPQNWIPGKQNGRPVNVRYTLPIKYQLY